MPKRDFRGDISSLPEITLYNNNKSIFVQSILILWIGIGKLLKKEFLVI